MAVAVLQGLKNKYVGLEGDKKGKLADIVKDKDTGLFTGPLLHGQQEEEVQGYHGEIQSLQQAAPHHQQGAGG